MANQTYNAESITVLEGLEAVRKRPGMYIGSVGTKGLNHLIYEIVDNAVDEHLAGFCSKVWVTLEADGSCTVRDNGRGIPVELHKKGVSAERVVLATLHAGGKFDNEAYKTSGGLHGVGSSVVNALSTWLEVEISRDGKVYAQRFERGVAVSELTVIGASDHDGTLIRFQADPEIFTETTEYEFEVLQKRLAGTGLPQRGPVHPADRHAGSGGNALRNLLLRGRYLLLRGFHDQNQRLPGAASRCHPHVGVRRGFHRGGGPAV